MIYLLLFSLVAVQGLEKLIGRGYFRVTNMQQCKDYEDHLFILDIHRRKVQVNVCKYVDGGCKPFYFFKHESFSKFADFHIGKNVEKFLDAAGVDPPTFPIQPCQKNFTNFLFSYEDMPRMGVYGSFLCHTTILKKIGKNDKVVGCLDVTVEFKANSNGLLDFS